MRQILNFLLLPFYIVMRVFTRRKKRIYWRQKVYNVLGKGGIVMDETGCEVVIPGVKVYVVGNGNRSWNIALAVEHANIQFELSY